MIRHKFNIFPEIISDDYERLKNDIETNGFDSKQPIYTYQGAVLDGWNRQRVCNELKITPTYKEFVGNDTDAIAFVMRTNKRRNLTSSQWAAIAIEADEIIEKIKSVARLNKSTSTGGHTPQLRQLIAEPVKTDKKVAEMFNTNRNYINEAQRLKRDKPEVFEQIKSGEKTITEVKKEEKIEAHKENIEKIKEQIETENITITGLYDVVVIDPPWNYGREYNPETSRVANPYPEMSVEEIKKIQLPLKDNAVVFLWTTHAFIRSAFDILDSWGLNYKAIITWNKEQIGMGATIRMQCEFCLLAAKGKPIIEGSSERDIITEKRREHSRKPEQFYEQVDRMTTGRKLDYFARNERKGYDVYGTLENELSR